MATVMPAAGARCGSPQAGLTPRAVSPTFRSTVLPFGGQDARACSAGPCALRSPRAAPPQVPPLAALVGGLGMSDTSGAPKQSPRGKLRAQPPKATSLLPQDLPMARSEVFEGGGARGRRQLVSQVPAGTTGALPCAPPGIAVRRGMPYAASEAGAATPRMGGSRGASSGTPAGVRSLRSPRVEPATPRDGGAPHRSSPGIRGCSPLGFVTQPPVSPPRVPPHLQSPHAGARLRGDTDAEPPQALSGWLSEPAPRARGAPFGWTKALPWEARRK
mmetsp:Transcript_62811/g.161663  ORF Transcript_62811/g.161663 Transcript_62811/m.161663 type:complete len:274 (-) Transcript_62811:1248-2069(-)